MPTSRAVAASTLAAVDRGVALDAATDAIERRGGAGAGLDRRDRAFARQIVRTALRRRGQIDAVIGACLERPLPREYRLERALLRAGAAQLLFLDVPSYAAVHATVAAADHSPLRSLVNAVLRRVAREGPARVAAQHPARANTPEWLWRQWCEVYGDTVAADISVAHLSEPPLDLTVSGDPAAWASRLGGRLLPTGTVRVYSAGAVAELPGYDEGAWWVQDTAAAIPAKLLLAALPRPASECRVADLCSAPGGKTAQLAAAGASVTALDRVERLGRLRRNLKRLRLAAEVLGLDARKWSPPPTFDAVLVDAPCTSTGAARRHPDVIWAKRAVSAQALRPLQDRLLSAAASALAPGGVLVYSVCSLDPREGEDRIGAFLAARKDFARAPVAVREAAGILPEWVMASGDVRTLPCQLAGAGGMDGFYVARLRRNSTPGARLVGAL